MLIVGAGGLATQLFDDIKGMNMKDVVFWSEVETKYKFIAETYEILRDDESVRQYFLTKSKNFILCVGSIEGRQKMAEKFMALGGEPISFLSPAAIISPYINSIGKGSLVLGRVEIEPHVTIGENCLINKTANIGHGCILGNNCEIAPGVILTGEVEAGYNTYIGTRAVILPKVKIGNNAVIAAGAIVKKDVPDFAVVAGEMASIKFYKKS